LCWRTDLPSSDALDAKFRELFGGRRLDLREPDRQYLVFGGDLFDKVRTSLPQHMGFH